MMPPCSCGNCPICAGRLADELLEGHSPRARDANAREADAWFRWALELVDELGLSVNENVGAWTIAELRDRIRDLAMTCQETRQELRALYDAREAVEKRRAPDARTSRTTDLDARELVRLILMAHLSELERWPSCPPSSLLSDLRIREFAAEDHIDQIVIRLERATRAVIDPE